MDNDIKEYLEHIKDRMDRNNERMVMYKKVGSQLKRLFSSNKRTEMEKSFNDYLEKKGFKEGDKYYRVSYNFKMNSFTFGPLALKFEIIVLNSKGTMHIGKSSGVVINYSIDDLKKRGFKNGDYKRVYNRVYNGRLKTDMKQTYYAKDLRSG